MNDEIQIEYWLDDDNMLLSTGLMVRHISKIKNKNKMENYTKEDNIN